MSLEQNRKLFDINILQIRDKGDFLETARINESALYVTLFPHWATFHPAPQTCLLLLTVNEGLGVGDGFGVARAEVLLFLDPGLLFNEGAVFVLPAILSPLGEYRVHAEFEQRLPVRQ